MKCRWFSMGWPLSLALSSTGCHGLAGNGQVISQSRSLSGFTHVENRTSLAVNVTQGAGFSVMVTTDSNLQSEVGTTVNGDTLYVDNPEEIDPTSLDIEVTMPMIQGAALSGTGTLDVTSAQESGAVDVAVSSTGRLTFAGASPSMTAEVSSTGELILNGSATMLQASVSAPGHLDALALVAQNATLSLSSTGELDAQVEVTVSFDLSGSGTIRWTGPATVVSTSKTGSGEIIHF